MSLIAQPISNLAGPARALAPCSLAGPVPRYTAYPTADRFVEAFGPEDLRYALRQRANGAVVGGCAPLAIRVGVPSTSRAGRAGHYLHALAGEMSLVASMLGTARAVSRLNLGGPALMHLSRAEVARLVALARELFCFEGTLKLRVEVDTRTGVEGRLAHLRHLGCTELVVDLTQAAAGAFAGALDTVWRLVASAHRLGIGIAAVRVPWCASVQAWDALPDVLARLVSARPERLALSAVPAPPRGTDLPRLEQAAVPSPHAETFDDAIAWLEAAGYVHVGGEEFALRTDALAIARAQGRLFLGLDGFDDAPCADLIALGAGAVGQVGASYYQNLPDVAEYEGAIAGGQLPVARGLALARDDLARRSVIHALVCQGRVEFESIRLAHLIDPKAHFVHELAEMSALADAGLVAMDDEAIELTARGRRSAGAVAAIFDRYRRARARRNQCAALL